MAAVLWLVDFLFGDMRPTAAHFLPSLQERDVEVELDQSGPLNS